MKSIWKYCENSQFYRTQSIVFGLIIFMGFVVKFLKIPEAELELHFKNQRIEHIKGGKSDLQSITSLIFTKRDVRSKTEIAIEPQNNKLIALTDKYSI